MRFAANTEYAGKAVAMSRAIKCNNEGITMDWKLMRSDDSAKKIKKGLYNLNDDPHELKNMLADNAASKASAARAAELEPCFQDWMKRTSTCGQ